MNNKDYESTIEWLTRELMNTQKQLKNAKAVEKEYQCINEVLKEANKLLNEQCIKYYELYCEELEKQ